MLYSDPPENRLSQGVGANKLMVEFYPYPFWTGVILFGIVSVFLRLRRWNFLRLFKFFLLYFYILAVIDLTLFPIPQVHFGEWRRAAAGSLARINLIPFDFGNLFDLPRIAARELGGNILLTAPYGFGLPFFVRFKARRFPWLALAPGLVIEGAQLVLSLIVGYAFRGVDINDVLLNAVGAGVGYGLYCGLAWLYKKVVTSLSAS